MIERTRADLAGGARSSARARGVRCRRQQRRTRGDLGRAVAQLQRAFPACAFRACYRNPAFGFEGEDFVNLVGVSDRAAARGGARDAAGGRGALRARARRAALGAARDGSGCAAVRGAGRATAGDQAAAARPACGAPTCSGRWPSSRPELMHPTDRRTIAELWQRFDRAAHPLSGTAALTARRVPPGRCCVRRRSASTCPVTNGASLTKNSAGARDCPPAEPARFSGCAR